MTFLWPEMLWLLLAVPPLVAFYFWLLNRRKKSAVRYASLSLMKAALGPAHRLRRIAEDQCGDDGPHDRLHQPGHEHERVETQQ